MTDAASTEGVSPLGGLAARKRQIVEDTTLKLRVPRWENPEIWIEYSPADHPTIRKNQIRLEKMKSGDLPEAEMNANADLLVKHTIRVYAILDDTEYSLRLNDPEGDHATFDPDLAENLGLTGDDKPTPTARQTCRAVFITDGDLTGHANDLIKWSGYRTREADEAFEGE